MLVSRAIAQGLETLAFAIRDHSMRTNAYAFQPRKGLRPDRTVRALTMMTNANLLLSPKGLF